MSWPQWPPTGAMQQWTGTMAPAATGAVGPLNTPGTPYTPEQWAAMQQQNWQQWMQWQQQYQQWQQQYGEQYHNSVNALANQTIAAPVMPVQPVQPPLPAVETKVAPPPLPDTKPPLPPDDPPPPNMQTMPPAAYNANVPPPNMAPIVAPVGPPGSTPTRYPPPPQNYQSFPSTNPPLPVSAPQTQLNHKPEITANIRPHNFGRPEYGKRPAGEFEQFDEAKKNRWETQPPPSTSDSKWNSNQSNILPATRNAGMQRPPSEKHPPSRPNVEELSEAEKNFDKQFEEWEAQFNKWKEQNVGHPDKQQYKEYEARWESWRTQLLERREQMRRKRLGLLGATQPSRQTPATNTQNTSNLSQQPVQQTTTDSQSKPDKPSTVPAKPEIQPTFSQPPVEKKPDVLPEKREEEPPSVTTTTKSEPGEFDNSLLLAQPPKEQRTNLRQRRSSIKLDEVENTKSYFQNSTNEIPGLDLVKDNSENLPENDPPPEEKKPPFLDAIAKGIDTILGDQKLMSILSMVTQKQPPPEKLPADTNEEINANPPEAVNQNFLNQKPSDNIGGNFNRSFNQGWPMGNGPSGNFAPNSTVPESFQRNTQPPNSQSGNQFYQGPLNQARPHQPGNFSQPPPQTTNFNQPPPLLGNFNQGNQPPPLLGNFNQGNQFNQPPRDRPFAFNNQDRGNFRQDNFNQGFPNRNMPENRNFNQTPNDFNQFSLNKRSGDFGRRPDTDRPPFSANRGSEPVSLLGRNAPNRPPFEQDFGRRPGNFFSQSSFNSKPQTIRPFNYQDQDAQSGFNQTNREANIWKKSDLDSDQYDQNSWQEEESFIREPQDYCEAEQMSTHSESQVESPLKRNQSLNFDENSREGSTGPVSRNSGEIDRAQGPADKWSSLPRRDYHDNNWSRPVPDRYSFGPDSGRETTDKYWDEALILKPVTVVDYGHKSLNRIDQDTFIEPIQTFDYGHSSKNVEKYDKGLEKPIEKPLPYNRYSRYSDPENSRDYSSRSAKSISEEEHSKTHSFSRNRPYEEEKSYADRRSYDGSRSIDRNKYFDSRSYSHYDKSSRELSPEHEPKQEQFNKPNSTEPTKMFEEKSSVVTMIEDLLSPPGRNTRPPRIVIMLRGPPGSGKTFLAKLIKDKEMEHGGSAPRILSLDDYFMVEQEKEVVEEESGRKTTAKEMVYEYEECMELAYRQSLEKAFKKTITDGFFPFIILDCINDKLKHFSDMWSFAKQNGFQVYVCQLELDVAACTKRNIHHRSEAEIERLVEGWEPTPSHYLVLDATSLIQSGCISEVEMEEVPEVDEDAKDDDDSEDHVIVSKWERMEQSGDKLARLDGINKPLRPRTTMEDYLQLDDDNLEDKPGQKRVRWADLEERRRQEKIRAIGFVVGQTDWDRMMDPTQGGSALTQTKYIERVRKF